MEIEKLKTLAIIILSICLIVSVTTNIMAQNSKNKCETTTQNMCSLYNLNSNISNLCLFKLKELTGTEFNYVPMINCSSLE